MAGKKFVVFSSTTTFVLLAFTLCNNIFNIISCLLSDVLPPFCYIVDVSLSQVTATCFVDRLSNEYAAYIDVIQPVQVAVYEMKLGLSLLLSSTMQKKVLYGMGQDDMDRVQVPYIILVVFFSSLLLFLLKESKQIL